MENLEALENGRKMIDSWILEGLHEVKPQPPPWPLLDKVYHLGLNQRKRTPCVMHAKSLQSCPTLCDPMNCSPPGSSVHGILQVRTLEWVALLQGIFPTQGLNPHLSHLLHWQAGSLLLVPPEGPTIPWGISRVETDTWGVSILYLQFVLIIILVTLWIMCALPKNSY